MSDPEVESALRRITSFEAEAHLILGTHEDAASSRVVVLRQSYIKLTALAINQDDLFRQALRCAENELYRAAHVMSWAGLVDFLFDKLSSDGLVKLRAAYPAWVGADIYEMAESVPEYQFIEACRKLGLATKAQTNLMKSQLQRRNECAHPSSYYPDLNMTLGYIAELLQMVGQLQPKSI